MEVRKMAKIQLNVELENADSKESFDVECPYESSSAEVSNAAATLSKAIGNKHIIEAIQGAISPGSELHKHFLGIFVWKGHDKAGWHDVLVHIRHVIVDDVKLSIDELELYETDQSSCLTLQLVRDPSGPDMYFLEECS